MSPIFILDTSQSMQHLVNLACPPRDMVVERISSFIIPAVRPCSDLAKEKRLGDARSLEGVTALRGPRLIFWAETH